MAPVYGYRFFDDRLSSAFPLGLAADDTPSDASKVQITLGNESLRPNVDNWEPLSGWTPGSNDGGIVGTRKGAEFCVSFESGECFLISVHGNMIVAWPGRSGSLSDLNHFLTGLVLPLAFSLRGEHVLHAAGVIVNGRRILLAGNSGVGKSTLGAYLYSRGHQLLSDDCMLVRKTSAGYVGIPSFPSLRLWPESINGAGVADHPRSRILENSVKQRIDFAAIQHRAAFESNPLSEIFVLDTVDGSNHTGTTEGIKRLSPTSGFRKLLEAQMRLDTDNQARLRDDLRFFGELAGSVPVSLLVYRRSFQNLDRVHDWLVNSSSPFEARAMDLS